jgi:hypothetical protein
MTKEVRNHMRVLPRPLSGAVAQRPKSLQQRCRNRGSTVSTRINGLINMQ